MIEKCRHELKVIAVCWEKPTVGVYKLNTDSSTLNNPGKIGGGGILRDDQGNMVYAYAIPVGFGTNNKAEIQAAIHGVTWCMQHGYRKIILEVDSELLSNGSTTTAHHLGRFNSTCRNSKISAISLSTSNANIPSGKLIAQLTIYLNGAIGKISFNIFTLIINYLGHLKEVIFWKKWVCKISEGRNSEELSNHLEAVCNLFNLAMV
uniref:RNase H family protein n=2 Tax=Solanum tuberosum TaxID=4113 RepID=M1DEJ8_SOLTU